MRHYLDQIPLYVAGQLDPAQCSRLEHHIDRCPTCRDEMLFWQSVSTEIVSSGERISAPPDMATRALTRIHSGETTARSKSEVRLALQIRASFQGAFNLLQAQAYLVRRELWPASAGIMALGIAVALLSNHIEAITFLSPLVAAASLAALYGPEHDPAVEMTLATPTSMWKILLARLSVVAAYNLLLSLAASLAMLLIVPPDLLGRLILGWLAPMAFLSSLALLLSLWIGTTYAVTLTYGLWIMQYIQISRITETWGNSFQWITHLDDYRAFWQSPEMLFVLSVILLAASLLSTRYAGQKLSRISS